jgi:arylformamidase
VPADLVRAGCALSGLFELAPLVTTSINGAVGLDPTTAADASPLFWPPPPAGRRLVAAVGGDESAEFHRQSRTITQVWGQAGVDTEYLSIAGANHYTMLDELTKPDSAVFGRIVALTGR